MMMDLRWYGPRPSYKNIHNGSFIEWGTHLTMRGIVGATSLELVVGRFNSVEYATSIWSTARALSKGVTGT